MAATPTSSATTPSPPPALSLGSVGAFLAASRAPSVGVDGLVTPEALVAATIQANDEQNKRQRYTERALANIELGTVSNLTTPYLSWSTSFVVPAFLICHVRVPIRRPSSHDSRTRPSLPVALGRVGSRPCFFGGSPGRLLSRFGLLLLLAHARDHGTHICL